ncbi:ubiquinone/menaquinone biosynthesis methyltransferase [compost metagenome]
MLGKMFSKDESAYSYLPESVAAFPDGEDFIRLMDKIGFKKTKDIRLSFGISAIYTGVK